MKPVHHQQNIIYTGDQKIDTVLHSISEVSGYLWEKGWAERNGGNISVRISLPEQPASQFFRFSDDKAPLFSPLSKLSGAIFYTTGAGSRMRDVARDPLGNGCFLKIGDDGLYYTLQAGSGVLPTSELPSHLAIHRFLSDKGTIRSVVMHTHPTGLIALSHHAPFLKPDILSRLLWSMIPETRVFAPTGIGIVPYHLTGSQELAEATLRTLEHHEVVLWEKHGVLAVGEDLVSCFDMVDILSKSAEIYIQARMAGFIPDGLSDLQLQELADAFKLK